MSRKPTTGRFETRTELESEVLDRYRNTNQNIAQIARFARVSATTVSKILDTKGQQVSTNPQTLELGQRIQLEGGDYITKADGNWIEMTHRGDHSHLGAVLAVWRMEDDERSPKQEEFCRRLVASFNACAHIDLKRLESGETQNLVQQLAEVTAQRDASVEYERKWERMMMSCVGEDGPGDVVSAINTIKLQRDTAWRELNRIREAIEANPEESTLDEVVRHLNHANHKRETADHLASVHAAGTEEVLDALAELVAVSKIAAQMNLLGMPANANGPLPKAIELLRKHGREA